MKLYLRCVWSNKVTLLGFVLLLFAVALVYIPGQEPDLKERHILSSAFLGAVFLGVTIAGLETLDNCLYYLKLMEERGEAFVRLKRHDCYRYCAWAGYRVAERIHLKRLSAIRTST